ncbi:MAG: T9SS type A sorting domain-containing protein [candidate division KSB1 bacterium]|nr:T9SS type A sorting domain-containing protein [candidate division KSB1 bacterium]MDZ7369032.1 T9SS type A sorting domain-containing protein [candidate division KSB1 bacterium]MDZ7407044.1 T9SS type A sorting domain-containing protein [candidate division KSB1 bacterium]
MAALALRTQLNSNANDVIPNGQGGRYTLPPNTGLFVETVHESGAKYYAVVKWGETAIANNITPNPISYAYDVNDPVECHAQGTTTLTSGHRATAYYMWADGRDNHFADGQVLQSGTTTVGPDDLVSLTGITLYRDPDRVRIRVVDPTVAVESRDPEILPTEFSLSQNYPNPFNPSTVISFQLPVSRHVTLQVFDVTGREVATLVEGRLETGSHNVTFAPRELAGGIYFYRLTAGKFSHTRKALLMK